MSIAPIRRASRSATGTSSQATTAATTKAKSASIVSAMATVVAASPVDARDGPEHRVDEQLRDRAGRAARRRLALSQLDLGGVGERAQPARGDQPLVDRAHRGR